MSADNGIYVAEFPTLDGGREWRVIHAQAIENLDYYDTDTPEEAREIVRYYGNAQPFAVRNEAFALAVQMADEIYADDFCPILEYGINFIAQFPESMETYRNRACPETEQEIA